MAQRLSFWRALLGVVLACIATIAFYGIVLSLLWLPANITATYQLVTGLVTSALAVIVGGLVLGVIVRRRQAAFGAIYGFVFALLGFGYLLGANLTVLVYAIVAAGLGYLGGTIAAALARPRSSVP